MALTETEIRLGYFFVLGREPESSLDPTIYRDRTLEEFRDVLIASPEGRSRARRLSSFAVEPLYPKSATQAVCFIHLEKTGGTTFHEALARLFPADRVTDCHFVALHCISMADICNYQFISGHFDYYTTQFVPYENVKRVSVFRDPIDRLISLYRFHRAHPLTGEVDDDLVLLAHRLEPEEFFLNDAVRYSPRVNNNYLRVFGSSHYAAVHDDRGADDVAFARARERIMGLDAVGITEAMDESIAQCCRMLGLGQPAAFEAKQRTDEPSRLGAGFLPVERVPRTQRLLSAMADLVAYDQVLYATAKAAFERQRSGEAGASAA